MSDEIDVLYGLDYEEHLSCVSPEEVVEAVIDDACLKVGESFVEIADRIEWPIKVLAFRRVNLDQKRDQIASFALEQVLDWLDEDYSDPEGNPTVATEAMKTAANKLADAIIEDYTPWSCEPTGEVVEFTRDEAKEICEDD